jgi:hypothetical protein
MVVFGFLAFLLGHGKPRWQQTAYALCAAGVAVIVAFSRLYLGAHWFSDVVASFGLGLAWIAVLGIAYITHVHERAIRATPVLLIVLATLTFVGGPYAANHHQRDLARYAKPAMLPVIEFDAWKAGGWRSLPDARTEIGGAKEELFSVQWVATRDEVVAALAAAGWQRPAPWRSAATLLWLLPSTPIGELPVLPKFDHGQPPALTLLRPLDSRTRIAIRLWRVAEAADDAASRRVPVWAGFVATEQSRSEWGLIAVARTVPQPPAAAQALAAALRGRHFAVGMRSMTKSEVLLVW